MPLYEYECDACGPFTAWRRMSESSLGVPCESCGLSAPRVLSATSLLGGRGRRRGVPEPRLVERKGDRPAPASHACGSGHGGDRPWMLGH